MASVCMAKHLCIFAIDSLLGRALLGGGALVHIDHIRSLTLGVEILIPQHLLALIDLNGQLPLLQNVLSNTTGSTLQ